MTGRRLGPRQRWGVVVGALVAAALAVAAGVVVAPIPLAQAATGDFGTSTGSGSALVATAGDGRYEDRIVWVNWGANGTVLTNNQQVTTWQQVAATTRLEVTCTLSGVTAGALKAYLPGSDFATAGFPQLYRTGTVATSTLVSAIGLVAAGTQSFTVTCATARLATYTDATWSSLVSTTAVTLGGLVVAESEALLPAANETFAATPTNGTATTWRAIDAYAGSCSGAQFGAYRSATTNQLTLTSNRTSGCGNAATAVMYADGATGMTMTLLGASQNAVSFGYVLGADYGDAPATYGTAGAVVQPTWTGGAAISTSSTAATAIVTGGAVVTSALATMAAPTPRLGLNAFPNATPPYSATATGDTGWVVPPGTTTTADEDAFAAVQAALGTFTAGVDTYTLATVRCRAPGWVQGWIDWNNDGAFGADEASTAAVQCTSTAATPTAVTLAWNVPSTARAATATDPSFLRLVVAGAQAELAPTGVMSSGEVEDYQVTANVRALTVTKTAYTNAAMTTPATWMPAAGSTLYYRIVVTNVGNTAYTNGTNRAYLYDDLTLAQDDATLGAITVSTGEMVSTTLPLLSWRTTSGFAVGATATITYPMTVGAAGDGALTNVARASGLSTLTGVTCDAGSADQTAAVCARVDLYRVSVSVTKEAYLAADTGFTSPITSGTALAPGTAVVWRYTVTNTGGADLTNVRLSDSATDSTTTTRGTTTVTSGPTISCPGLPAVASGTTVVISSLTAHASRVCQASGTVGVG